MLRHLRRLLRIGQSDASLGREQHPSPGQIGQLSRRRRPVPDHIGRFYIPQAVLQATDHTMRRFGQERRECYVWWGGYFTAGNAQVVTALWPEVATDYGRIHLTYRELSRLQTELRQLDQVLLVELHTHPPGGGGQNEVDAAHPAATYRGFVTVVVPDFAHPRFRHPREAHVYEYLGQGKWRQLSSAEVDERFVIEPTSLAVSVDE